MQPRRSSSTFASSLQDTVRQARTVCPFARARHQNPGGDSPGCPGTAASCPCPTTAAAGAATTTAGAAAASNPALKPAGAERPRGRPLDGVVVGKFVCPRLGPLKRRSTLRNLSLPEALPRSGLVRKIIESATPGGTKSSRLDSPVAAAGAASSDSPAAAPPPAPSDSAAAAASPSPSRHAAVSSNSLEPSDASSPCSVATSSSSS